MELTLWVVEHAGRRGEERGKCRGGREQLGEILDARVSAAVESERAGRKLTCGQIQEGCGDRQEDNHHAGRGSRRMPWTISSMRVVDGSRIFRADPLTRVPQADEAECGGAFIDERKSAVGTASVRRRQPQGDDV